MNIVIQYSNNVQPMVKMFPDSLSGLKYAQEQLTYWKAEQGYHSHQTIDDALGKPIGLRVTLKNGVTISYVQAID